MKWRLVAGLGNDDPRYRNTFHNVGFLAVDFLREKIDRDLGKAGTVWIKPKGGMNRSGTSVAAALRKEGLKPEELLVVHDDADIALGAYKLSFGRGAGGHGGVEDVIARLGTNRFWRLRVGVRVVRRGKPSQHVPDDRLKAGDFVLSKISAKNREVIESVLGEVAAKIEASLVQIAGKN